MSCHKHKREHEHIVQETKMRSLLKSVTGRILEITLGTLIFGLISGNMLWGFTGSLANEILCAVICYGNERAWNKIQYGRKIIDVIVK